MSHAIRDPAELQRIWDNFSPNWTAAHAADFELAATAAASYFSRYSSGWCHMDSQRYQEVLQLELDGSLQEAGAQLIELAAQRDPLALIELGFRHLVDPSDDLQHFCPGKDPSRSQALVDAGKERLLELAELGDAEAMRMLGYLYLDLLGPYGRSPAEAEVWLRRSFEAGCYFAANDLFAFYLGRDRSEAHRWYRAAEEHGCRVVHHDEYEL